MKIRLLVLALCISFSINAYSQEPFPCDDRFYQVVGFDGELSAYDLETDTFTFAPNNAGTRINAGGRNPADGFAYFISVDNNDLIRMGTDGSTVNLGSIAGLPMNNYSGGDFWRDGLLYVNPAGNGDIFNTFYGIDVDTATVDRVVVLQGLRISIPDMAYNPIDELMYAVTSSFSISEVPEGNLIAINLSVGTYQVIGPTDVPVDAGIASVFADGSGRIYGANRFDDALLYEFNIQTAESTAIGRSILLPQGSGPIDGFFCAQNPGPFPPASTVPTLSEWGLIAMATLLGIVGFIVARRKKVIA